MNKIIYFIIAAILALVYGYSGIALAHAEHQHQSEKTVSPTAPTEQKETARSSKVKSASSSSSPSSWQLALMEHWHHKMIHFPVALGLFAALLLFMGLKWESAFICARWTIILAFLTSLIAFFTGQSMLGDFASNNPYFPLLERHRLLGIVSIVLLGSGSLMVFHKPLQRWMWLYALFLMLSIGLTGFYGGWIAHG